MSLLWTRTSAQKNVGDLELRAEADKVVSGSSIPIFYHHRQRNFLWAVGAFVSEWVMFCVRGFKMPITGLAICDLKFEKCIVQRDEFGIRRKVEIEA